MNRKEPTLITVRRTLAEVNAALADATPAAPFARFRVLMAVFNEERTSSRPCGCWDFVVMPVET
jgi:hypothetical protein